MSFGNIGVFVTDHEELRAQIVPHMEKLEIEYDH